MTAIIVRGDARRLPLPDASVDLVVTSPPYWAMRDYRDGGGSLGSQLGAESTPGEYIAALLACTAEWARVLKPEGNMFVDLSDSYSRGEHGERTPAKSLRLLPERYRIGCVDELGLTVRETLVWSKTNPMPDSAGDRARRTHEDWVHLTLRPRYYSAIDALRQPHVRQWTPGRNGGRNGWDRGDHLNAGLADAAPHPLGKPPPSVWEIATEPLNLPQHLGIDHHAAFPLEWPRRLITGWCPPGICVECGQGRRPATRTGAAEPAGHGQRDAAANRRRMPGEGRGPLSRHGEPGSSLRTVTPRHIAAWVCDCPTPDAATRPAVVLDPCGGTGTTALAASVLGRVGISVDLSGDYCGRIARWRTTDPGERARAARLPRPEPVPAAQLDLWTDAS